MKTGWKLSAQLNTVLTGNAWYGDNVYTIIDKVMFETAFEHPPGGAHTIAEIVLHLTGWTEEVIRRMQGHEAGMPPGGDWPPQGTPSPRRWQIMVNDFKLMNTTLDGVILGFEEEKWGTIFRREASRELATGGTYEDQVTGLIQHHVYHAGQIALLNRMAAGS